jgi:hypothetical protein
MPNSGVLREIDHDTVWRMGRRLEPVKREIHGVPEAYVNFLLGQRRVGFLGG